jgi:hypothetical protein
MKKSSGDTLLEAEKPPHPPPANPATAMIHSQARCLRLLTISDYKSEGDVRNH